MSRAVKALLIGDDVQAGGLELIETWQKDDFAWIWLDIEGSIDDVAQQTLIDGFGLSPVHMEEAMQDRHPPAFDGEGEQLFVLVKPLDAESYSLDFSTQQLALFEGPRFIVTRHSKHSPYLNKLQGQVEDRRIQPQGPSYIADLLLQRMISRYGAVLFDLERRLDEVEDELVVGANEALLQELVGYNTALRKMRRILRYQEEIMRDYAERMSELEPERDDQWEQLSSGARRFHSLANMYQGMIRDLIDGYISLNAHHLNQVMRLLTVVTVIFVPLTLLVGIYGMNFEHMPELHSHYGYFILLGLMASIAGGLVWYFRRRHWL